MEHLSIYEFMEMESDEQAAAAIFENARWHGKALCPHCGSFLRSALHQAYALSLPWLPQTLLRAHRYRHGGIQTPNSQVAVRRVLPLQRPARVPPASI